jgi:phage tail tape-measure protein
MKLQKLLIATGCLACAGAQFLTTDSTLFGNVLASVACGLGSLAAGRAAYNHYDAIRNAGKNSAESVNAGAKKIQEELQKKLK